LWICGKVFYVIKVEYDFILFEDFDCCDYVWCVDW